MKNKVLKTPKKTLFKESNQSHDNSWNKIFGKNSQTKIEPSLTEDNEKNENSSNIEVIKVLEYSLDKNTSLNSNKKQQKIIAQYNNDLIKQKLKFGLNKKNQIKNKVSNTVNSNSKVSNQNKTNLISSVNNNNKTSCNNLITRLFDPKIDWVRKKSMPKSKNRLTHNINNISCKLKNELNFVDMFSINESWINLNNNSNTINVCKDIQKEKKRKKKNSKKKSQLKNEIFINNDNTSLDNDNEFNNNSYLNNKINLKNVVFPKLASNPFFSKTNVNNNKNNNNNNNDQIGKKSDNKKKFLSPIAIHKIPIYLKNKNDNVKNILISKDSDVLIFQSSSRRTKISNYSSSTQNSNDTNNNLNKINFTLDEEKTPISNFLKKLQFFAISENFQKFWEMLEKIQKMNKKDINYQNEENGYTYLHYSSKEGNIKITEKLLKLGCDPNIKNKNNETPLHLSSIQGYFDISKLLIDNGALLDIYDNKNNTPLHYICLYNHIEILKYLLVKFNNIEKILNVKNIDNKTPYDLTTNSEIKLLLSQLNKKYKNTARNSNNKLKKSITKNVRSHFHYNVTSTNLDKYISEIMSETQLVDDKKLSKNHFSPKNVLINNNPKKLKTSFKNKKDEEYLPLHNKTEKELNITADCQINNNYFQLNTSKIDNHNAYHNQSNELPLINIHTNEKTKSTNFKNNNKLIMMNVLLTESENSTNNDIKISKTLENENPKRHNTHKNTKNFSLNKKLKKNNQKSEINKTQKNENDNKKNKILNSLEEEKINPCSFICLGILGKGSFGEVYLVQKITTKENFAMKVLRKEKIIRQNLLQYVMTERNVLTKCNHPFIVKLNYAFQTNTKLFLIMEHCQNGDLAKHLLFEKKFSENRAKFYICEILLSLEYLHERNIIFRDLKPDNVVLDENGHCKLTDFGLSKEGIYSNDSAKSFCGSIAYLAPEVLKKQGHGKAVDWYLLGVLFYEMLVGKTPYTSENKNEIFYNIEHGELKIPDFISKDAHSLLRGLLERDPKKRLGGGKKDSLEIKNHCYFKDVNWNMVYNKKYKIPNFNKNIDKGLKLFSKPKLFANEGNNVNDFQALKNKFFGWSFVANENL